MSLLSGHRWGETGLTSAHSYTSVFFRCVSQRTGWRVSSCHPVGEPWLSLQTPPPLSASALAESFMILAHGIAHRIYRIIWVAGIPASMKHKIYNVYVHFCIAAAF